MSTPHTPPTSPAPLSWRTLIEDNRPDRSELWNQIAVRVLNSGDRDALELLILTAAIHCSNEDISARAVEAAQKLRTEEPTAKTDTLLAAAFPHLKEFSIPETENCRSRKYWIPSRLKLEGECIRRIARHSQNPLTIQFLILTVAIHHPAFNIRELGVMAANRLLKINPWNYLSNMCVDRAFPQDRKLQERVESYFTKCKG